MDQVLEELRRRFDSEGEGLGISTDDFERWQISLIDSKFYDDLSCQLAFQYHANQLSYDFCDRVVNDLWSIALEAYEQSEAMMPALFIEVYSAFDDGEYHRVEDKSDDPVAEHTDPQIADIVRRLLHEAKTHT